MRVDVLGKKILFLGKKICDLKSKNLLLVEKCLVARLDIFFYLISRPVGIFLLMGVWTSWDITSIECPGKLGHFFCWVSRLVGTCFLLGAWMSLF